MDESRGVGRIFTNNYNHSKNIRIIRFSGAEKYNRPIRIDQWIRKSSLGISIYSLLKQSVCPILAFAS